MSVSVGLGGGDSELEIRRVTQANFDDIAAQANDPVVQLDTGEMKNIGGRGLTEFRKVVNENVSYIDGILGPIADLVTLDSGESWATMRAKLNSLFTTLDAAID